jgi:hypothetical protein
MTHHRLLNLTLGAIYTVALFVVALDVFYWRS